MVNVCLLTHSAVTSSLQLMNCSPTGPSIHGTLQAILEWVAISYSRGSSWPRDGVQVSCIGRWILHTEPPGKSLMINSQEHLMFLEKISEIVQSCPTLCDPMDCSLPGSSVHGILQARVLEWVAISFSRGSSRPRDQTPVSRIPGRRFNRWATREAQGSP